MGMLQGVGMANLPTDIVDFKGFYSSIILILKGGIIMSIGDLPGKFESNNVSRVQC